jgi:two-component system response regulator MprA
MPNGYHVLVVDDDPCIRYAASRRLEGAGYKVSEADSGESGLSSINAARPDAVLLDVMMPLLDGLKTLERMRAEPTMKQIPVVMLSASLSDQQRALNAGARFFLRKPYCGADLLEALDLALKSAAAS